jgi:hypothetical protein
MWKPTWAAEGLTWAPEPHAEDAEVAEVAALDTVRGCRTMKGMKRRKWWWFAEMGLAFLTVVGVGKMSDEPKPEFLKEASLTHVYIKDMIWEPVPCVCFVYRLNRSQKWIEKQIGSGDPLTTDRDGVTFYLGSPRNIAVSAWKGRSPDWLSAEYAPVRVEVSRRATPADRVRAWLFALRGSRR